LGLREIITQETPNGISPSVIAHCCSKKLLESKLQQSQFHKDVKKTITQLMNCLIKSSMENK
jgi:uncharacterized membrane protein YheB (UPF0754 family)